MQHEPSLIKQIIESGLGYFWFLFLAVWGGTANYLSRRKTDSAPFSFAELVGEWAISGFAGIITALLCQHYGISEVMTYAAAGLAGHMGGRSIALFEQLVMKKLGVNK